METNWLRRIWPAVTDWPFMVANSHDTSYPRSYGKRVAERPDVLDVDHSSRIRPRLGSEKAGGRHPGAGRPRDAQSAGARGLAWNRNSAAGDVAFRRRFHR